MTDHWPRETITQLAEYIRERAAWFERTRCDARSHVGDRCTRTDEHDDSSHHAKGYTWQGRYRRHRMTERHATPETIDAVKAKAKPGDTIHLGPGNYNRSTLEGLSGVRLIGSGPGMSGYTELRPTND